MSNRTLTITHQGATYSGNTGRIVSTHLGPEDHGIFTAQLTVEGQGWGIGVGGYNLTADNGFPIDHLHQIMQVLGAETWEQIRGRDVVVLFSGDGGYGTPAVGIAHPVQDRVLIFKDHAQQWAETTQ